MVTISSKLSLGMARILQRAGEDVDETFTRATATALKLESLELVIIARTLPPQYNRAEIKLTDEGVKRAESIKNSR